jgi:hypothetical protein
VRSQRLPYVSESAVNGRTYFYYRRGGVSGGAKVGQWSGATAALRPEYNPAIG